MEESFRIWSQGDISDRTLSILDKSSEETLPDATFLATRFDNLVTLATDLWSWNPTIRRWWRLLYQADMRHINDCLEFRVFVECMAITGLSELVMDFFECGRRHFQDGVRVCHSCFIKMVCQGLSSGSVRVCIIRVCHYRLTLRWSCHCNLILRWSCHCKLTLQ